MYRYIHTYMYACVCVCMYAHPFTPPPTHPPKHRSAMSMTCPYRRPAGPLSYLLVCCSPRIVFKFLISSFFMICSWLASRGFRV